ncbi:hypothetical protein RhiXN_05450 [Rhizoctonia solani]|uniref:Uncharacterized protein n=1 Tax=Rhizoctonia solani TaxID=456999 RepID=A0A8H8NRJ9_9AGAM|nr:uncharacterized protein RhiXN_05450 [Rhizoctonia solani]QRW17448.1 hypothetical protein RhiXN_05450 [Rhizoctonia solani]
MPVYPANTYKSTTHRLNLGVLTEARATNIDLDHSDKNGKTRGTSFQSKSKPLIANAGNEVVLSAGEFIVRYDGIFKANKEYPGTLLIPELLEPSSIDSRNVLRKRKTIPKIDLSEVGEKYQDHILVSTTYEIDLHYLASCGKIAHMHGSLWEDLRKERPPMLQKE